MLGLSVYNGSGRAVRDKYVFDFPANADVNYAILHCQKPVRIKSVRVIEGQGNFASYTVRKNSATAALPVDLAANDHLTIELTGWNNSLVQLEAGAELMTTQRTAVSTDLGGNGRYLFCMNYVDQSVSIIDTGIINGVHPNESHPTTNLALPAGFLFRGVAYRNINKSVYVFGNSRIARIDADPDSPTFKTVVADTPVPGLGSYLGYYVYDRDLFYCTNRGGNTLYRFNPNTLGVLVVNNEYGVNFGRGGAVSYLPALDAIFIGDESAGQLISRASDGLPIFGFGIKSLGQTIYNPKDGMLYQNGFHCINRLKTSPIQLTQSIANDYFRQGDIVIVPGSQKCFGTSVFSNRIGVADISGPTVVSLGSVLKTSPSVNETASRSIIYSPYSQRVYVQASANSGLTTGVNRVHILNPALPLANMYAGYCDVGNMDSVDSNVYGLHQMCLNQVQL